MPKDPFYEENQRTIAQVKAARAARNAEKSKRRAGADAQASNDKLAYENDLRIERAKAKKGESPFAAEDRATRSAGKRDQARKDSVKRNEALRRAAERRAREQRYNDSLKNDKPRAGDDPFAAESRATMAAYGKDKGTTSSPVPKRNAPAKISRMTDKQSSLKLAAYRNKRIENKDYKGKYYGPDAFKGNISILKAWRRAGGNSKDIAKFASKS